MNVGAKKESEEMQINDALLIYTGLKCRVMD
jgi:hypothetical protein